MPGAAATALVGIVLTAGCSPQPDAKDAQADVDGSRSALTKEVKDAARVLVAGGWQVSGLGGGFLTCSGTAGLGSATIMYSAGGGTVTGGTGTLDERIRTAGQLLEASGWKIRKVSRTGEGGEYSRLTRNGLGLAIDPDQLKGSQDFGFTVNGECVAVTDEQFANVPNDEPIVP